mmetsp:Transcript_3084/g.5436  ORF Transcript_3084/g.5436 Transcript_3084/m.5436 type:complete len:223 (-) Transcript_3084:885-1553(-)
MLLFCVESAVQSLKFTARSSRNRGFHPSVSLCCGLENEPESKFDSSQKQKNPFGFRNQRQVLNNVGNVFKSKLDSISVEISKRLFLVPSLFLGDMICVYSSRFALEAARISADSEFPGWISPITSFDLLHFTQLCSLCASTCVCLLVFGIIHHAYTFRHFTSEFNVAVNAAHFSLLSVPSGALLHLALLKESLDLNLVLQYSIFLPSFIVFWRILSFRQTQL